MKGRNDLVYAVVRKIPSGLVATYGQVAALAGLEGMARQVGYALHELSPGSTVPWHRVVNARGEISLRSEGCSDQEQRARLESEGVHFDERGRISMKEFGWLDRDDPPARPRRAGRPGRATGRRDVSR